MPRPDAEPAAPPSPICVVDEAGPLTGRGLLAELSHRGDRVWLLGGGALRAAAREAGFVSSKVQQIPVPTGHARWSAVRLRPAVERLPLHQPWEVWSLPAARALRRAGARGPITLHLHQIPDAPQLRRLNRRPVPNLQLATTGPGLADAWLSAGLTGYALQHLPPQPPPPPPRGTPLPHTAASDHRSALRRRWGIDDPELPVVVLLADVPHLGETHPTAMTVNLAAEASGRDLRLLLHPEQFGRARVQRLQDAMQVGARLVQEPAVETPWSILHAVDAALLTETPAPRATAAALAAGVPVVAPDRPWHRDLVTPDAEVYFAPTAEPKKLADRLHHLALKLPIPTPTESACAHGPIVV